ncbi:hypothetical protein CSV74_07480 [Sporosarcina sp. P19]|uniref:putative Ig domain-containing protein n=1 Tax=Sporosarcina sp. P19 TaxID=2048258 RepID=UPI000C16D95B|nr:putative Ig domain-containing protein [Sporosarcina sp. P19]PIC77104.1 hypothetical protein CSV74_07480 [Sporosarcina sp. P19]
MKLFLRLSAIPLLFLLTFCLAEEKAEAAVKDTLEIGEVKSLSTTVDVPVILHGTLYLTSANLEITLQANHHNLTIKEFIPAAIFTGSQFRSASNIANGKLTIDVISTTGKQVRLAPRTVIGHITYEVPSGVKESETILLEVERLSAIGRTNTPLTLATLEGKIIRKMPPGDVVGKNKPNAAGAVRILQHVKGTSITNREEFLSADVDGDQLVSQADAQIILDYVAGKRHSFIAMKAADLSTAAVKSDYTDQVQAINGREPYSYRRISGSMPSGLTISAETGQIMGIPSRAGVYNFDVEVTDAVGESARKAYSIEVVDTNIISTEKLAPINVKKGSIPELPSQVAVTYKDKTTGKEHVNWTPVDTSTLGTIIAKGKTESGFGISVELHVVEEDYIVSFNSTFSPFVNLYIVELHAADEVSEAFIDGIELHYEGDGVFKLGTNVLQQGASASLTLRDKYGDLLETKSVRLD